MKVFKHFTQFRARLFWKLLCFCILCIFCRDLLTPHIGNTTLVVACKLGETRLKHFKKALHSWISLRELSEIIIIDWFSSIDMAQVIKKELIQNSRKVVKLITVKANVFESPRREVVWRIAAAVNLGLTLVNQRLVLKVDCDTWLHDEFLLSNSLHGIGFRYGDYRKARPHFNDFNLNGVFYARLKDLRAIHGLDERFTIYGWDDSDMYMRLEDHLLQKMDTPGVIHQDFVRNVHDVNLISHLPHERSRSLNEELFGVCFNRAASGMWHLDPWQSQKSVFRFHTTQVVQTTINSGVSIMHHHVTVSKEAAKLQHIIGRELCEPIATFCGLSRSLNLTSVLTLCDTN